jgi:hypothetical protein
MFLKIKEFGGISFRSEESVSLSIVHVGPYLVALVCIPPFTDYLFRVCVIFWFLYFDLFQLKLQLVSKWMMDYIAICLFGLLILILAVRCQLGLLSSDFNQHRKTSTACIKTAQYEISRKDVQLESCSSIRTNGRTDMARLMVAFHDCFKNAPNKVVEFSSRYVQFWAKDFEREF